MSSIISILPQLRQSFELKGKATFWFGGVIAAIVNKFENNMQINIQDNDMKGDSLVQFIQIINHTLVNAMIFYSQNPPDNFYKFINFCHQLVTHKNNNNSKGSFKFTLTRLTLRNNLIIQALQIKQYNQVFSEYQQIVREYHSSTIDTLHPFFVGFFSNFFSLLSKLEVRKSNYLQIKYLSEQIRNNMTDLLRKLIEKYQNIINGEGTIDMNEIQILFAVFIKHKSILEQRIQSPLQSLISNLIYHTKYRNLASSLYINKIYKQKINKQIILKLQLPFYQFNCFILNTSQNISSNNQQKYKNKLKKHLSTKEETQKQDQYENQTLLKIQKMLQQHLLTVNSNHINYASTINSTQNNNYKQSNSINSYKQSKNTSNTTNELFTPTKFRKLNKFQSQTLQYNQTIQNSELRTIDNQKNQSHASSNNKHQYLTQRKAPRCGFNFGVTQHMVSPTKIKHTLGRVDTKRYQNNLNLTSLFNNNSSINSHGLAQPLLRTHNVLHFKVGSIFIEVNDDGMLFSDYTKENKRYVQWNTISQILLRVQYKFMYKSYLCQGIYNYYDIVRILKLYLSKSETSAISINQYPNMILQLNEFIRFYQQDGRFTKLAHMNIYDNTKLQSEIDCYLEEFDHFFKTVSSDGYLEYLQQKTFKRGQKERNIRQEVFYLQVLRKHNDSIRLQLQNQLTVDIIESVTNDREFLYRALFVLKKNVRLYAKIQFCTNKEKKSVNVPKTQQDCQGIVITIKNLSQQNLPIISHTLSCHNLQNYIPLGQLSPIAYVQNYGRLIFQSFNNFENFSDESMASMLNFQIITHCYQTEMIEIGKYWTVCSAQLIGSKRTIFGIVIRYAFLPMNKDFVTFLRNPYYGFLSGIISMTKQQKKQSLKNLLIDQSVKQTYLYLQRAKKINGVSSLIEYLSEGLGII